MIQAEEKGGLGDGQKIETGMAKEAGIKVIRTYQYPSQHTFTWNIEKISKHIQAWYANGCKHPELLENVFIGIDHSRKEAFATRPLFEKL